MLRRTAIAIITLVALVAFFQPLPAAAVNKIWTGYVVHVSTDNIKVINTQGTQTLSFLILPKFNQLFSDDGKNTYQMDKVKRNYLVKVYFDQNLLGARHADKIYILSPNGQALKRL
jgi:hypothetical protein